MVDVTSASSALWLISGDEDLLVARAVEGIVAAARASDPETEVRDIEAATQDVRDKVATIVAELFSPSLFGGRRVVVLRSGQDAKKDLVATLLAYARSPESDVQLVVEHAGGAKGKPLADGLRAAGATVVSAAKVSRHRERVDFVRAEFTRLPGVTIRPPFG